MGPALAHLAALADQRPGVLRAEGIGQTLGGHTVWAFHVAEPGVPVQREVLVMAGIHALEWIGTDAAMALLDELIARPLPGVSVTVVPFANPDGRIKVEADLTEGAVDRYRRGNLAAVDLNRDWAVHREPRAVWRHLLPARYEASPAPLSQPETRALDALAARHDYDAIASLHAFGGYLYHPWAGRWGRPDAWADHVITGRQMERAQGAGAYRTRQLSRWGFFFRAQGTELDHVHEVYGAQTWLVEITRSGLQRPSDRKVPYRWYNPRDPQPHLRRTLAALRVLLTPVPEASAPVSGR